MKSVEYIKRIIEDNLCCGCGMCSAVCPKNIFCIENGKSQIKGIEACINCSLCENCCPAGGYRLNDLDISYFKNKTYFLAESNDDLLKKDSSAGGFITGFLQYLLSSHKVDYVCVVQTGASRCEPLSKYIITNNINEVINSRKSKYTQASMQTVVEHIKNHDATYAIVALPCQWYGLHQYCIYNKRISDRILYKIGLVCGYTYEYSCIDALLNSVQLKKEDFFKINGWRMDGLPGFFSLEDINGNKTRLPFDVEHSIDVTFYAQNRCLLCKDFFCEYADLAASDIGGWRNVGTLLSIHNNSIIASLIEAKKAGSINLQEFDAQKIESTVIPFMIREKRNKVDKRISYLLKNSKSVPKWSGGSKEKLTIAHRLSDSFSVNLQRRLKNKRELYLKQSVKMEKLGKLAYHGIDRFLPIRVLNKFEELFLKGKRFSSRALNFVYYHSFLAKEKIIKKNRPLHVGIIGIGNWGANYFQYLNASSRYTIESIYDCDIDILDKYSKLYGVKVAKTSEEMVNDESLDAVFLLTPPSSHKEILSKCRIEQNFYIEKPLESSYDECIQVMNLLSRKKGKTYVAHSMKFEPCVVRIKEIVEKNLLGTISYVEAVRCVPLKHGSDWRKKIKYSALYNLGVHLVEVFHYIFGKEDKISSLRTENFFSNEAISDGAILHYDSFDARLLCAFDKAFEFVIVIEGENGSIIADGEYLKVKVHDKEIFCEKASLLGDRVINLEIKDFYSYVVYNKKIDNDLLNAVNIMETIHGVIKNLDGENQ